MLKVFAVCPGIAHRDSEAVLGKNFTISSRNIEEVTIMRSIILLKTIIRESNQPAESSSQDGKIRCQLKMQIV